MGNDLKTAKAHDSVLIQWGMLRLPRVISHMTLYADCFCHLVTP